MRRRVFSPRRLAPLCDSLEAVDFSETALRVRGRASQGAAMSGSGGGTSGRTKFPAATTFITAMGVITYVFRPRKVRQICASIVRSLEAGRIFLYSDVRQSRVFETAWWGRDDAAGWRADQAAPQKIDGLELVRSADTDSHVFALYRRRAQRERNSARLDRHRRARQLAGPRARHRERVGAVVAEQGCHRHRQRFTRRDRGRSCPALRRPHFVRSGRRTRSTAAATIAASRRRQVSSYSCSTATTCSRRTRSPGRWRFLRRRADAEIVYGETRQFQGHAGRPAWSDWEAGPHDDVLAALIDPHAVRGSVIKCGPLSTENSRARWSMG